MKVIRQDTDEFVATPYIEVSLVAVTTVVERVGVFSTKETTVTMGEITQYIFNGFARNLFPSFIAEQHSCMHVDAGKQCLVVEHFFEVGDEPHFIHAVSREAATNVVVHAATGHGIKRCSDDIFKIAVFTG